MQIAAEKHKDAGKLLTRSLFDLDHPCCVLQVDSATGSAVWIHPIDIHLASKVQRLSMLPVRWTVRQLDPIYLPQHARLASAQGLSSWPKLHFQVWQRQKAGRAKIRESK